MRRPAKSERLATKERTSKQRREVENESEVPKELLVRGWNGLRWLAARAWNRISAIAVWVWMGGIGDAGWSLLRFISRRIWTWWTSNLAAVHKRARMGHRGPELGGQPVVDDLRLAGWWFRVQISRLRRAERRLGIVTTVTSRVAALAISGILALLLALGVVAAFMCVSGVAVAGATPSSGLQYLTWTFWIILWSGLVVWIVAMLWLQYGNPEPIDERVDPDIRGDG